MSAVIAQLWKPHSCFVQPTTPKMIHLVSSKTKDIPQIVTFEKLYFFFCISAWKTTQNDEVIIKLVADSLSVDRLIVSAPLLFK